jgi:dimethylglycine dehydrogenase
MCIDFEGEIYMRQERGGMLLGTYEQACVPWSPRTTPWDFGQDLLPNDLERIAPSLEVGSSTFPRLAEAGIRKVVNGPFTFAPDGNPLVGPIKGLRNYWVACGVMAGFSQGGGVGPGARELDGRGRSGRGHLGHGRGALRRLGDERVHERQGARKLFAPLPDPLSERGAAGGAAAAHLAGVRKAEARRTPCSATTAGSSTRSGSRPRGASRPSRSPSTAQTRTRMSPRNAARCAKASADRDHELRQVRGQRAGRRRLAVESHGQQVPKVGRLSLSPMLNERGRLIGDFTLGRVAEERVFLVGTYAAESYYQRWFERSLPPAGVSVRPCAMEYVGLSVAGPQSRALLQALVAPTCRTRLFRS